MRQYQEAFAKLDADDAGAILSFAAFVGNYADDRLASSLEELLNDATSAVIQIN